MRRLRAFVPTQAPLLLGLVLAMAWVGLERGALPVLSLLYGLAFLIVLHAARSREGVLNDPRTLLLWAIAFRVALFPTVPDLSDDAFRYIWDGWLSSQGENPYARVPADAELSHLQGDRLFTEMNSPLYFSIYPPLSQILFLPAGAAHAHIGWPGSFYVLKATILLLEITGLALLLQALRRTGRRLAPFVLYAWNPLVLVAVAGNAHSEGAMMLGVGLLVWGLSSRSPWASGLGVAAAGMVKVVPFAWSLLLLRFSALRWGWRRTAIAAATAAGLSVALLLPFWFPGLWSRVTTSAELYVRHFEFNAGLYFLLKEIGVRWTGEDPSAALGPALRVAFLLWLVAVSLLHSARDEGSVIRGFVLIVTGYLLLATTVHPWYLLWVLPFLPFTSLLRPAWLWASFASFGTYFTYWEVEDPTRVHLTLTALVWLGFLLLLLGQFAPAAYDGLLRWAGRRKARHLAPHLEGKSVLDLGAGEGYVAAALAKRGRQVVAADVAPMRKARVPYAVYDGRHLPFPSKSVDHVVLSLVLHHARDADQVVREAFRVARGTVVVTESTYRSKAGLRLLRIMDRAANRFRGGGVLRGMEEDLHFRTVEEWEETFRKEGGRVVRTRWLNRTIHRYVLFEVDPSPAVSEERGPRRGLRGREPV